MATPRFTGRSSGNHDAEQYWSAAADSVQATGFVADADLLELDPRSKQRRQIAHKIAEIHTLLGREVERQLLFVPLPFGVGDLHRQAVRPDALHGFLSRFLVQPVELRCSAAIALAREPERFPVRCRSAAPVRAAAVPLLCELAEGMYVPEILTAVGIDDDRRF